MTPESELIRICGKCKLPLSLEKDFNRDKHRKHGRRYTCRSCQKLENSYSMRVVRYGPDYDRAVCRRYRAGTGRFRMAVNKASSRAKRFGVPDTLTKEQWEDRVRELKFICQLCGIEVSLELNQTNSLSLEHIIPLSRGGANSIENVVPACYSCNHIKGELTMEEFRDKVRKLHVFLIEATHGKA